MTDQPLRPECMDCMRPRDCTCAYLERKAKHVSRVELAQNNSGLDGVDVARACRSFASEFKGEYPYSVIYGLATAVGAMHAFLGHCVELGILTPPDDAVAAQRGSLRLPEPVAPPAETGGRLRRAWRVLLGK